MRQLVLPLVLAFGLSACGEDAPTTTATKPPARAQTTTAPAEPEPAPKITASDRRRAIAAVRAQQSDAAIYRGAKYRAITQSAANVCVTREFGPASGFEGDLRFAHFVVTVPGFEVGEALEGTCAKPRKSPDERISLARLDAMARELKSATLAYLDGGGSEPDLRALAKSTRNELDNPLPVTTKKANLIHSATAAIPHGLDAADTDELRAAVRYLNEALAE